MAEGRSSDSTDSLHWRYEFTESFRSRFAEVARLEPGDWTWRLDYSHQLCVVIQSKSAGRLLSVNLPENWRKMPPETAAHITVETVRDRLTT